jgi:HlyD family secretion protein
MNPPEPTPSTDNLDELLQVTTPRLWVALVAVGVLLASALAWGIFGKIPTTVHGQGILLKSGGLYMISSFGAGQVKEIEVKMGEPVRSGAVVAHVSLPDLERQLTEAKAAFAGLKAETDRREATDLDETKHGQLLLVSEGKNLQQVVTDLESDATWLDRQTHNQQSLLDQGLISRETLVASEQQLSTTRSRIDQTRDQIDELTLKSEQLENGRLDRAAQADLVVDQSQRTLTALEEQFDEGSNVTAPYDGRVIEILVRPEDLVDRGTALIQIEHADGQLAAVLYVAAQFGKHVKPGMPARLSPSNVKKERYGLLLGQASSVSEFPSTTQAMSALLKNDALVSLLAGQGPQFEVHASLIPDPDTPSGYRWTSAGGSPAQLEPGTLCEGDIVVEEQAPITLVMPYLRGQLGL